MCANYLLQQRQRMEVHTSIHKYAISEITYIQQGCIKLIKSDSKFIML